MLQRFGGFDLEFLAGGGAFSGPQEILQLVDHSSLLHVFPPCCSEETAMCKNVVHAQAFCLAQATSPRKRISEKIAARPELLSRDEIHGRWKCTEHGR